MSNLASLWQERTGGCLCGAIRYRVVGEPLMLTVCHCTDCQVRSGGAFSMSLTVLEDAFTQTKGEPIVMTSRHEDRVKYSRLCAECHTRVWLTNTGAPGVVIVKAGTLDERDDLRPVAHLWVRSRQPWVTIDDDVLQYETQPSDYTPVLEAWAAQLRVAEAERQAR